MWDLTPLESPLRPHCRAADRLLFWRPPSLPPLPPGLTEAMRDRMRETRAHSIADSTRGTYGAGLLLFHVFCDSHRIPEDQRAPAQPLLVQAFLASLVGGYSGSAVSNYLNGLHTWHTIHGVDWLLATTDLKPFLAAAKRIAVDVGIGKPPRSPYTVSDLEAICAQLDDAVSLDCAVKACVTATFWGIARVKEMTVVNLTDNSFNPVRHLKITDVSEKWDAKLACQVTALHAPSTKASPLTGEDIFFAQQLGPADAKKALAVHVRVNDPQPLEHLFTHTVIDGRGRAIRRPLSRSVFIARIKRASIAANIIPKDGHSLRIGGTLEYLLRSVPFPVVQHHGRWAGNSFTKYLTKHAVIIAPYIQAPPSYSSASSSAGPPRSPFPPLPTAVMLDDAVTAISVPDPAAPSLPSIELPPVR
ncbi:hypothetical protein PsYK624_170790 [Phanerochaete sordida]|uniref:Uncharacterized protein n=1 Tax=Phanerochaete sordida TaxID=48140 RepID=A0A9P3GSL5_9APHY|nr:hypothetical protein PsYK624_170790 [Phanerochaete sordida]